MLDLLTRWIEESVVEAQTQTGYRTPLVALASVDDPGFEELPKRIPGHLRPCDLLPHARSVCAFFLPFARSVVAANAGGDLASEGWALAYVETNALLARICERLAEELGRLGISAAWQPPTHTFDPVRLVSTWSHKSVAVVAGLGQLGHHHMLITEAGCAGRLGSVVLDVDVSSRAASSMSACAYDRGCRACIERCPVGALTDDGFDRTRCYVRCLDNDARFPQWLADVCGKCATGPCAMHSMGDGTGTGLAA